jgi:ribonucleoside-diphosphate reductase alpha chain
MLMGHRQALPNRRRCETFDFEHAGHQFSLTFSCYPDGRPAEIFLSSQHVGSPIEAIAHDAAVTVSIALQHGAHLSTIYAALTKDHDGGPATLLGAALAAITEASR